MKVGSGLAFTAAVQILAQRACPLAFGVGRRAYEREQKAKGSIVTQLFCSWRHFVALFVLASMLGAGSTVYAWQDTPAVEEKKEEKTEEAPPAATTEEAAATTVVVIDPGVPLNETNYSLDNMLLMFCAVLVIFMQAGFTMLEVGLNASKNAVNILFKNFVDFCIGVLLFFLVGFGIMYPGDNQIIPGWFGFKQVGISMEAPELTAGKLDPQVDFLFQVAFAATAATIVSGAVAGRIKFAAYLVYTVIITALIYPISGMWMWGGGWLFEMGFKDFAGSIVVHSVGGFAGLAGAIVLGPRIGRFVNGKSVPMPGHNLGFATLGVFILLVGWYGFNPGSQLAFAGGDNIKAIMRVAVNTTLSAAAGGLVGTMISWGMFKKPDLTFAMNGMLAGLVGITANCHCVSFYSAIVIGSIAGVIVVLATVLLDKLQIDDPVGAFQVHGACGMWGGIATGIFGIPELAGFSDAPLSLTTQIVGTLAIGGWAFGTSLIMFFGLKAIGLLRVPAEEEIEGLDITEHGMYAYPPQLVVDAFPGARPPASGTYGHGMAPAGATSTSTSHA